MKIVILNAGMGQRLGRNMPKCLNYVNKEEKILDRQLKILGKLNAPIYCLVGFKKEIIMEEYPHINYIYNEKFHQTNTSKSLLRAFEAIKESDDTIWINGDVFLPNDFPIKNFQKTRGNIILCNKDKNCGEEEVKYKTNSTESIIELSKKVSKPEGEALGLNLVRAKYFQKLKTALEKCRQQDYFEKGCEFLIKSGINFKPYITDKMVREIDTHDDLERIYNTDN